MTPPPKKKAIFTPTASIFYFFFLCFDYFYLFFPLKLILLLYNKMTPKKQILKSNKCFNQIASILKIGFIKQSGLK